MTASSPIRGKSLSLSRGKTTDNDSSVSNDGLLGSTKPTLQVVDWLLAQLYILQLIRPKIIRGFQS